jgi:uncharacterized membrane protein
MICLIALKGDVNEFYEIELGLNLCQYTAFSSACVHDLIEHDILQCLADLMLRTKSSQFCLKILNAIDSLIGQEEFLSEMKSKVLIIKNKPEIIYVEEKVSEPKKSRERSKERHKRESKDNKRSKSRSIERRTEKKRKVIENNLGEVIESDQEIQTLYQLLLSLLLAKQNSSIIKKLKSIIKKVNLIEKLKELNKEQGRLAIAFNLESVYEYLQDNTLMTNELGQLLNRYKFVQVLLDVLVVLLLMNRVKMCIW